MKLVKYATIGSLSPSIFDPEFTERLRGHGLQKSGALQADLWVVRSLPQAKKLVIPGFNRRIVAWSSEPRWDSSQDQNIKAFGFKHIDVFNIFTGDVFWHNRHFLTSYHYIDMIDLGMERGARVPRGVVPTEEEWLRRKLCLAVSVYHSTEQNEYIINGVNLDLKTLRQEIALAGAKRGVCDVVGRGWPEGIAMEASGFSDGQEDWWTRKMELLRGYRFAVSLENTVSPYYVTEKIWQSIRMGVLPIYYGGGTSTVYEIFPEDSFLDRALYQSDQDMLDAMEAMTYGEWRSRLEKCIATYDREVVKVAPSPFDEVVEAFKTRMGYN